eukprot:CAMPEP_0195518674 /NCGR_PEP_ID=MMETSP0794_2-20130614/13486_1 /TAXON_ID=515487 /ORGANISM="Stephanopyxis turris, Strain CCMP 815" /LENGTH=194 /DNA_ID=CAMNT_0040647691 /DNA_START=87 /DNA_END=671 /DNA_ORIENTATION=+
MNPLEMRTSIDQVILPPQLSIYTCGFITVQHFTRTLALWQCSNNSDECSFQLMAIIPHSLVNNPRVIYDGRRLIAHGKDAEGMVIFVYQVLGNNEIRQEFLSLPVNNDDMTFGGVVRLVNTIRHLGLGGNLENYEFSLKANERFLVVNTKTGDLVNRPSDYGRYGGGREEFEGLFLIDLEGECHHKSKLRRKLA